MPVPGFLSSLTDKFSGVLPSHDPHALESIQHQLRSLGQQYSNTTPVQRIITIEKGVAIDFDSLSRDAKAQSKELYTWGQAEEADIKDVTDRLAYLNFVHGSLASSLAVKLDAARAPLKNLRDAEAALLPRRNIRAGLQLQLTRIEHDQPKGMEKRMAELKDQLKKHTADDQPQETEVELLKRQAVRESEQHKWEAIREYGEKLVLLSQAATPIIAALPTFPPTPAQPYAGGQATGAARASLQRALDNYKTGHINLPPQTAGSDLSRSDTRSFGESHARELSSMTSDVSSSLQPGLPVTPPPGDEKRLPPVTKASTPATAPPKTAQSPPLDPSTLNLSPAPIPSVASPGGASSAAHPIVAPAPISAAVLPTVAETGVPVSAGADGPGPASGSLHNIKAASSTAGPRSGGAPGNESSVPAYGIAGSSQKFESASDEKKRLQAYSEAAQQQQAPPAAYETAEEEKKRLEREDGNASCLASLRRAVRAGRIKDPRMICRPRTRTTIKLQIL
ncbi:Eisosome component PIL1-domain-containing protein [Mycena rosella]|uniref:Eisosome component PIL1-domain-containing protein n=1 Tax=Mycena rosella TaxID=1033263 RepID=A0AAD7GVE4_MYCRO|nr:Eisosome component PIL1-domain-containing protein [Mycena rosella]